MNRPVSPLLHDYKPSAGTPVKKTKAARWFAFGLVLPLAGVALILAFNGTQPEQTPVESQQLVTIAILKPSLTPTLQDIPRSTTEGAAVSVPVGPSLVAWPDPFHPPLLPPAPVFDSITLSIRRGDTLDRLFRKHGLNLGHLASIVRRQLAGSHSDSGSLSLASP